MKQTNHLHRGNYAACEAVDSISRVTAAVAAIISGMALLALVIKPHTSIRLAELGEALLAAAGILLLLGGMTPFGRRAGQTFGGICLAIGGALLLLATRWGHFH